MVQYHKKVHNLIKLQGMIIILDVDLIASGIIIPDFALPAKLLIKSHQ